MKTHETTWPTVAPFREARETLGVDADAPFAEIKRAYRRLAVEHPPDRDPEAFQRIRSAFELLSAPRAVALDLLMRPVPRVPPPAPRLPEAVPSVPQAILQIVARELDAAALLGEAP